MRMCLCVSHLLRFDRHFPVNQHQRNLEVSGTTENALQVIIFLQRCFRGQHRFPEEVSHIEFAGRICILQLTLFTQKSQFNLMTYTCG